MNLRSLHGTLPAVLSAFVIAGCDQQTLKWKEQVELQSKEILTVSRTAKFEGNWIAGGGGGSLNKGMTLEILQPARPDNPGPWSDHFVPVLLDRDGESGEWVLVATFYHCSEWYEIGRPALPYTEYRFRSGKWVRQPLSEKWIGREVNVLPADLSDKEWLGQKGVVTTEQKNLILSSPTIAKKFVQIIGNWATTC